MLQSLANSLVGKGFPGVGYLPESKLAEFIVDRLGRTLGRAAYALTGWSETVPESAIRRIRSEDISWSVLNLFPQPSPQAVMIGSANGALMHLCAAMRTPWLPQTFLLPIRRRRIHPDNVIEAMEWGKGPGEALLRGNPDLVLHQMHDPDHDRVMVQRMAYFRVKRRRLGPAYSLYLEKQLRAGATVYLVDCRYSWLTKRVNERHFFQLGGAGGVTDEEYLNGSDRVAGFLAREGSDARRWNAPQADGETPEGEWGFQQEMGDEIVQLARRVGGRVVRISFEDPEDLSPLVADFYRWWYERQGTGTSNLLTESFIFLEPYWALRTGSVPFWMVFNGRNSANRLERYLDGSRPYDNIYMMLLSNGIRPIEGISVDDWRVALNKARVKGQCVGVNERKFPYDFASFLRYNRSLQESIPTRQEMPDAATVEELESFVARHGHHYAVQFKEVVSRTATDEPLTEQLHP